MYMTHLHSNLKETTEFQLKFYMYVQCTVSFLKPCPGVLKLQMYKITKFHTATIAIPLQVNWTPKNHRDLPQ